MSNEPLPLPINLMESERISQLWWFCLVCGHGDASSYQLESHWRNNHAESPTDKPIAGVDTAIGSQVALLKNRRLAWIEKQAQKFLAEMHAEFGADDFVAEAEIRDA